MGHPNWQRLAELGQLPEYMKDVLPANYSEANENARHSRNNEPNKEHEVEVKDIEDIINDVPFDSYEEELKTKKNSELRAILEEKGLDSEYAKNSILIERILAPVKENKEEVTEETDKIVESEVKDEEKVGEFVDEILN